MCWNATVSLQSFAIGALGIVLAALTGRSLPFLLFYATIVCMQLVEFVVWEYGLEGTPRSNAVNYGASMAASMLLAMQPIASLMTLPGSSSMLITAYIVLGLGYHVIRTVVEPATYEMKKGADGHLAWGWLRPSPLTLAGLLVYFVFLLLPLVLTKQMDYLVIVLATLGASLWAHGRQGTWGSMWCWVVNWMVVGVCGLWAVKQF